MRNTNKSGFRWKRSGILLAAVIVLLAVLRKRKKQSDARA